MTEGDTVTAYTYDKANRLTSETTDDYKQRYTYDKNGNMICRLTDRYTDASIWSGEELRIGVLGSTTQAAQNLDNSYAVYYTYDEVNALTDVQSDDGMVASYVYNADGRRIQKTVNGVTTTQMWDRDCIIGEKDANENITATYYRAAHLVASKQGDTVSTYAYDPHGSVVTFGGTSYQYDAFGNQLTDTTADNPFRYCGEYYDSETGFIYLRNRYYDTVTGRFITEDPVRDGLNWYVYCGNNPVKYADPRGLSFEELKLISRKFSINIATRAYQISEYSKAKAEDYAKYNNINGTFDNEADAYRHFIWNAKMTREIGYDKAIFIGNLHERKSLSDLGWIDNSPRYELIDSTLIYTKINQVHLMDLWNNQVGRELANNQLFRHMTTDELFNMALENNWLITDVNKVYDFLGIVDYVSDAKNWAVNAKWDVASGNITVVKDNKSVSLKIGV